MPRLLYLPPHKVIEACLAEMAINSDPAQLPLIGTWSHVKSRAMGDPETDDEDEKHQTGERDL